MALWLKDFMAHIHLCMLEGGPQKYGSGTQQPQQARQPHHCQSTARKLTEMERYRINQLKAECREDKKHALDEARAAMWDFAKAMHECFGRHTALHYYHLIMHQTHLKAGSRVASQWNAFLSLWVEQYNSGMCFPLSL